MKRGYLPFLMLFAVLSAVSCSTEPGLNVPGISVEMRLIDNLGEEHIANVVYRYDPDGDTFTGWGDRIVEWPVESSGGLKETVPNDGIHIYSNGGCAMDVDGDGSDEIVVGRSLAPDHSKPCVYWFDPDNGDTWTSYLAATFDTGAYTSPHDIVPVTFNRNGDVIRGVVTVIARKRLVWLKIPDNPHELWIVHDIAEFDAPRQSGIELGDINGDIRTDVVCGMFWAECPKDPENGQWTIRRYGDWDANNWGGMASQEIVDLDVDGVMEIAATEAEIPDARFAVFRRNMDDIDELWAADVIDSTLYCPHSLISADLNADDTPDLITGEMTAGGWEFPMNDNPQILAWLNRGDGSFIRVVIHEGLGVHEMKQAPEKPDRSVMIYSADEIQPYKFKNMNTHVVNWLIRPTEK
ncbi:MAG: hypothetical protein JXB48_07890 [Candidatus Latescibacteria bacterium]|nr:hypothetical protein [Candidatus Latescibacterota bacterium]